MAENGNKDEKKGGNIGCLIVVIIFVIGSIAYGINSHSYDEFAEIGAGIMVIAGLVAAYFILKYFGVLKEGGSSSSDESTYKGEKKGAGVKGCLAVLGVLLFFGLMAYLFSASTEVNHAVGIIVLVVVAVGLGILFYSMKDD